MRHKFFSILFYRAKARGRNWSINTSPSFFKFHFNERQWHFSFLFRRKHQSRVHRFYVFIACAAQHPRPSIPTFPRSVTLPFYLPWKTEFTIFQFLNQFQHPAKAVFLCHVFWHLLHTSLYIYIYIYIIQIKNCLLLVTIIDRIE